jgi:hypothetical protein
VAAVAMALTVRERRRFGRQLTLPGELLRVPPHTLQNLFRR